MKKVIMLGALTVATLAMAGENLKTLSAQEIKTIESSIPMFKNKNITIAKGYERTNLWVYQLETKFNTPRGVARIPAFVDKKTKVVYVGSAYTKDGKKLVMPVDKALVEKGVAFTYGSGEKGDLYLFTDPECPFCTKLEKDKGEELKKYKVHVILFPLSFHEHSKPMVEWILRGKGDKERAERFKKAMSGDKTWAKDLGINLDKYNEEYRNYMRDLANNKDSSNFFKKGEMKKYKAYLEKSKKAFYEVGAKGTPTIKDANFHDINPGQL